MVKTREEITKGVDSERLDMLHDAIKKNILDVFRMKWEVTNTNYTNDFPPLTMLKTWIKKVYGEKGYIDIEYILNTEDRKMVVHISSNIKDNKLPIKDVPALDVKRNVATFKITKELPQQEIENVADKIKNWIIEQMQKIPFD